MRLNRRNVLVGLGTIVAGGGAAIGTGAFSSVEADRTVSIKTAGDANAFLGLDVDDDWDSGGDTISVDLSGGSGDATGSGLNIQAVTKFQPVLAIENRGSEDINSISFDTTTPDGSTWEVVDVGNVTDGSTEIGIDWKFRDSYDLSTDDGFSSSVESNADEPSATNVTSGDVVVYDLEVDTRTDRFSSSTSFDLITTITAETP